IRPISNTVEIFVTGLDAASLSFLANEGISFSSCFVSSVFSSSLLTASHIFVAMGVSLVWFSPWTSGLSLALSSLKSGNWGSSCSTTMCFLSRDQPLTLDFTPFGFCITLRRGSASGMVLLASFVSSEDLTVEADSAFPCFILFSVPDSAAVSLIGAAMLVFESSGLILVASIAFIGSRGSETAFVSGIAFCSGVWTLSLPKSFLTAFRGSWSAPLGRGCLASGVFVFGVVS
uniref:Uncharacterized protein n=1 Tax=Acanthochromis polyacanthus TaxID=80966 RepID=A0A3Q1GQ73_9TELE